MKRICLLLLCAALLLCACGTVPTGDTTAAAVPAEPADASDPAAQEALSALLGELRQTVTIGTAGSSLRAAAMAARLLDWAETAEIHDEQILAALEPWLEDSEDGVPADFREQLGAVDNMFRLLTEEPGEEAEAILSDAGCEDCGYPWSEGAIAAVERIMALAGLREAAAN